MKTLRKTMLVTSAAGMLLAGLLAGCAASSDAADASSAQAAKADVTIFNCAGLDIALPAEYLDLLLVTPSDGTDSVLISVSEKASVEAGETDGLQGGIGWLFAIDRMTQAQYEQYLCLDHSGEEVFARDEDYYYSYSTATDVQFYRSGGVIDTSGADWRQWEKLYDMAESVRGDMIERNGLTAYSDQEFQEKLFTYDSDHIYVKYYRYLGFDGSRAEYDTMVLSQPTRQGEGGVWCMERWYDPQGNVNYNFPDSGLSAKETYAPLQTVCDNGEQPEWLTPLGAVKAFSPTPYTEGCWEVVPEIDEAYFAQNNLTDELLSALYRGDTVADRAVLDWAAGMTADNWGVLGRFHYGSDWWTSLSGALKAAAVGEDQAYRNAALLSLFLACEKTDGIVAEGLGEILHTQVQSDPAAFAAAVEKFTWEDQARVQTALKTAESVNLQEN